MNQRFQGGCDPKNEKNPRRQDGKPSQHKTDDAPRSKTDIGAHRTSKFKPNRNRNRNRRRHSSKEGPNGRYGKPLESNSPYIGVSAPKEGESILQHGMTRCRDETAYTNSTALSEANAWLNEPEKKEGEEGQPDIGPPMPNSFDGTVEDPADPFGEIDDPDPLDLDLTEFFKLCPPSDADPPAQDEN